MTVDTYFVISGGVAASTTNRTRKDTEDLAVEYAKQLLKRRVQEAGLARKSGSTVPPLYVVKLVKVVEVEGPPVVVRDPTPEDGVERELPTDG